MAKGGKWNHIIPDNKETIKLEKDYDFSYLIPDVKLIKNAIEEYCTRMNGIKFVSLDVMRTNVETLEAKNTNLQQQIFTLTYNTATNRIKNQLSYKLGRAMIDNSKSLWGYIRMPYVLSYIRDIHNKEQMAYNERIKKNPSLKLPSLESYSDYKEALKYKEHLSYKLGQALIKASKNWYKGGYIKLWFEVRK